MNKKQLIEAIILFDASIVWEIDSPLYYPLIGWSGEQKEKSTWWLKSDLEGMKNKFLKKLLDKLVDEQFEIMDELENEKPTQANHRSPFQFGL